jgi:hypothetical protein
MTLYLRQSTATTLPMGQFVDSTDGATPKTALSLVQADIRLSKNGGDPAQKHEATTATHKENGYYAVPIDETDTNTPGRLRIMITKATSLGVKDDLVVLPAVSFDVLISGTETANITFLVDRLGGKTQLIGNQMICYKSDNVTEVCRFDLKDSAGNPSMASVYEKSRH